MGRKPNQTKQEEQPLPDAEIVRGDLQALDQSGMLMRTQNSALNIGRVIGTIEYAIFSEIVSKKYIAAQLKKVKESKEYKNLQFVDGSGNVKHVSTFDEFCIEIFKFSGRRGRQILDSYETIGDDDLFEYTCDIGFSARDYRALQILPTEDRELVRLRLDELEQSGAKDKTPIIDLIETLTERHAKKLLEVEKKLSDANEDAEATSRLLAKKNEREEQLLKQISRYEGNLVPADERLQTLRTEFAEKRVEIDGNLRDMLVALIALDEVALDITDQPAGEADHAGLRNAIFGYREALDRVATQVGEMQMEFNNRLQPLVEGHDGFLMQQTEVAEKPAKARKG